jgi:hypothetical protein
MATASTPKKKVSKKAVKKAASKKSVKKAATKKASRKKAAKGKAVQLTHQERYEKIAEAAYLLAEGQGFAPGSEMDNWLKAEQMIDSWIADEGVVVKG